MKGRHEPIITEELWDQAQAPAVGSKFAPSRGGRRPARHLFTGGLLRCLLYGEAMLPRSPATASSPTTGALRSTDAFWPSSRRRSWTWTPHAGRSPSS